MTSIPGASGGTGKWVALLLVVFVLLGGAVGGGLWWWNSKKAIAAGPGPVGTDPIATNVDPVGVDPVGVGTPVAPDMNPIPVGVETPTMVELAMVETPTMVEEPAMVEMVEEPTMTDTPPRMTGDDNNPAAERLVARGRAAIGSGNLSGAIDALRDAQRLVGRSHSSLRSLRNAIAERGAREVGFKVVNQCRAAQDLYRELRTVGAEGRARDQFFGGCSRP